MTLLMVDDVKVSRRCVSHSLVPVLVGCSLWLQQASNGEISRMRYVIAESGRPANAFRRRSRVRRAACLASSDRNQSSCSPNVRAVRDIATGWRQVKLLTCNTHVVQDRLHGYYRYRLRVLEARRSSIMRNSGRPGQSVSEFSHTPLPEDDSLW